MSVWYVVSWSKGGGSLWIGGSVAMHSLRGIAELQQRERSRADAEPRRRR